MTDTTTPAPDAAKPLIARWLSENLNTLSGMDDLRIARRLGYATSITIRQWKDGTRAVPPGVIVEIAAITKTDMTELFPLWAAQLLSQSSPEGQALVELARRCVSEADFELLARLKRAGVRSASITDDHLDQLRWMTATVKERRDALLALDVT